MKRVILATALSLACAAAFAQSDPYAVSPQIMQQSIQQSMQGFQQAERDGQAQLRAEQEDSQRQFDNLSAINQQADAYRAQEQQDAENQQALQLLQEENATLQQAQQQDERDAAQDPDDGG